MVYRSFIMSYDLYIAFTIKLILMHSLQQFDFQSPPVIVLTTKFPYHNVDISNSNCVGFFNTYDRKNILYELHIIIDISQLVYSITLSFAVRINKI